MRRHGQTFFLALLLVACGSKSPLLVPEGVDAGLDAGTDAGPEVDICIDLPFNDPPEELRLDFVAQIQNADIYFLVDVTGSMEDEINRIQETLTSVIIPGLVAEIPEVRLSVGRYADFFVPDMSSRSYGSRGDDVYRLVQASTPNVDLVLGAVNRLILQSGGDTPESLTEALYQSATGDGVPSYLDPASCPPNTNGYPCFPEGSTPIFVVFTDAPTHNGPGGAEAYNTRDVPDAATYEDAVTALNAINAKVLGLNSGEFGETGRPDLEAYARDTGAVREDGTPIVLDIGSNGELLSNSVVEAVRTLVTEVPIDVDVLLEDSPSDELDARTLVAQVIAESAVPMDGAQIAGDRFDRVRPGTRVEFRILFQNLTVRQTDVDQEYLLNVVLRGDRISRLSETLVKIAIPRIGGGRVCPPGP